ncbi:MAG: META domain-containing protein [Caldilineaceae bacterium]|nr:META domain-containing protein [Caldilineaceae bacterium]
MVKIGPILLLAVWLAACVVPGTPLGGPPPVSPLIPNQVPVLLENQWRLTEVIHNGTRHDFDAIEPVLATFHPGAMALQACNSFSIFFDTTNVENPNEYRFLDAVGTARGCVLHDGTNPEGNLIRALRATHRYEIEGDTLIFSGEHAQVTFVIDNEATKPPDWM